MHARLYTKASFFESLELMICTVPRQARNVFIEMLGFNLHGSKLLPLGRT